MPKNYEGVLAYVTVLLHVFIPHDPTLTNQPTPQPTIMEGIPTSQTPPPTSQTPQPPPDSLST